MQIANSLAPITCKPIGQTTQEGIFVDSPGKVGMKTKKPTFGVIRGKELVDESGVGHRRACSEFVKHPEQPLPLWLREICL